MSESSYELEKTRKAVAAKDLELASFKVPRNNFFFGDYCLRMLVFFLSVLFVGDMPRTQSLLPFRCQDI